MLVDRSEAWTPVLAVAGPVRAGQLVAHWPLQADWSPLSLVKAYRVRPSPSTRMSPSLPPATATVAPVAVWAAVVVGASVAAVPAPPLSFPPQAARAKVSAASSAAPANAFRITRPPGRSAVATSGFPASPPTGGEQGDAAGGSPPPSWSARPEIVSETNVSQPDGFTGFCDRRRCGTSTPLRRRPPTSSGSVVGAFAGRAQATYAATQALRATLGPRPSDLDAVLSIVDQIPSDQPQQTAAASPREASAGSSSAAGMSASIATPAASRPGPMYPGRSLVECRMK